jgi:prophage regulatory protein
MINQYGEHIVERYNEPVDLRGITILKLKAVLLKTGLSCSSLYVYLGNGTFPKQVNLGPRSVGWIESEVDGWIVRRMGERK